MSCTIVSKKNLINCNNSFFLLVYFWKIISKIRKKQIALIFILIIISSLAEFLSISSVLPFLGVLTSPERVLNYSLIKEFSNYFFIRDNKDLLLLVTIIFALSAVFSGVMRLILLISSTRLSFSLGADMGNSIYNKILHEDYIYHLNRNSSEVVDVISAKVNNVIYSVIMPALNLVSSVFLLLTISALIVYINPLVAFFSLSFFSIIYFFIIFFTKNKLITSSLIISKKSTELIKSLQEGLGSIREILIDGTQKLYCKIFREADAELRKSQGSNQIISQGPRYLVEALGIVFIAFLAYFSTINSTNVSSSIPLLGALALGAQKLLPILQNIFASLSSINGSLSSFKEVLNFYEKQETHIDNINDNFTNLNFKNKITVKNLSYKYLDETFILKNLNIEIKKGTRIGIIGSTGSGKSTFIDIIMGLLQPTEGSIIIDDVNIIKSNRLSWQLKICHVPQSIYLSDSTIEENIAFGVDRNKIDKGLVLMVAKQAQLHEFIDSLKYKYLTPVGERGVQLSGGQRQRIGIARALYKQAEVIIFDEATSALDTDTETAVMNEIENLNKNLTIIIVAHRLSTLRFCDKVYKIENGKIEIFRKLSEI